MTELQIVPNTPALPDSVAHVPSTPHKPIVVLTAVIGGTTQTWYVYGDDDEDVAHKLPRVHRYIQELRKKFGGEEITQAAPAPVSPGGAGAASSVHADDQLHDCEWHGQMHWSTKVPGTQYCNKKKSDGSWCPSKWPKRAGEQSA